MWPLMTEAWWEHRFACRVRTVQYITYCIHVLSTTHTVYNTKFRSQEVEIHWPGRPQIRHAGDWSEGEFVRQRRQLRLSVNGPWHVTTQKIITLGHWQHQTADQLLLLLLLLALRLYTTRCRSLTRALYVYVYTFPDDKKTKSTAKPVQVIHFCSLRCNCCIFSFQYYTFIL